ncbi:hypothetical protein L798_14854 [Zootermopsis nevadensis]|uniref:Uncharacterized protein n=1 Tax=Zootermopsis nevadensis TaxID=136037 RepID=A0A067QPZ6_ZOONE|nr:hypothetical protein L798_14854 [Zootermopsis nevadensis]
MDFKYEHINTEVIDDMIFVISRYFSNCDACFKYKENRWCKMTNMDVSRSNMSTCVVKNLPNQSDYTFKHRDKLMEEKRKKMLDWENQ